MTVNNLVLVKIRLLFLNAQNVCTVLIIKILLLNFLLLLIKRLSLTLINC